MFTWSWILTTRYISFVLLCIYSVVNCHMLLCIGASCLLLLTHTEFDFKLRFFFNIKIYFFFKIYFEKNGLFMFTVQQPVCHIIYVPY